MNIIIHNGIKYRLQSTGRYYNSGVRGDKERLLHRRIWSDANGEIPDGRCIHHKDGDWRNNNLENLECVDSRKHHQDHMRERMTDPAYVKQLGEWREQAIKKAPEWHRSPEGIEWHRKHGKEAWGKRKPTTLTCKGCGCSFTSLQPWAEYCTIPCRQRVDYPKRKTATSNCAECGTSFMHNKYRARTFCGHKCANVRMGRDRT